MKEPKVLTPEERAQKAQEQINAILAKYNCVIVHNAQLVGCGKLRAWLITRLANGKLNIDPVIVPK